MLVLPSRRAYVVIHKDYTLFPSDVQATFRLLGGLQRARAVDTQKHSPAFYVRWAVLWFTVMSCLPAPGQYLHQQFVGARC